MFKIWNYLLVCAVGVSALLPSLSKAVSEVRPTSHSTALPNHCDPDAYGTRFQQLHYALMIATAYRCAGLRVNDYLNYGCYCGSGNTGIDTKPVDALDNECRQHDLNLWAICENPAYNTPDGKPCNCYEHFVKLTCESGKLHYPAGLSACQQACLMDTVTLVNRSRSAVESYKAEFDHRWAGFGANSPIPRYCTEKTAIYPKSPFMPSQGVELPGAAFWPVGKLQPSQAATTMRPTR